MFRTIERTSGGSGGPQWLSSHPNPGNRYEKIQQEAALLRVNPNNVIGNTREFSEAQARLRRFRPSTIDGRNRSHWSALSFR